MKNSFKKLLIMSLFLCATTQLPAMQQHPGFVTAAQLLTTQLIDAAKRDDLLEVRRLALTAKVNGVDAQGRTALHWAALYGRATIMLVLITNGANPAAVDQDGRTPEFYAQAMADGRMLDNI